MVFSINKKTYFPLCLTILLWNHLFPSFNFSLRMTDGCSVWIVCASCCLSAIVGIHALLKKPTTVKLKIVQWRRGMAKMGILNLEPKTTGKL